MPNESPKPCKVIRCGKLTSKKFCEDRAHRSNQSRYEKKCETRESTAKCGYDARWGPLQKMKMRRDPLYVRVDACALLTLCIISMAISGIIDWKTSEHDDWLS